MEALPGMARVRQYLQDAVSSLPPDTGADDSRGMLIVPDEFQSPLRNRMRESSLPQGGGRGVRGSGGERCQQAAAWELIAKVVSNLQEAHDDQCLEGFDELLSVPEGMAA